MVTKVFLYLVSAQSDSNHITNLGRIDIGVLTEVQGDIRGVVVHIVHILTDSHRTGVTGLLVVGRHQNTRILDYRIALVIIVPRRVDISTAS